MAGAADRDGAAAALVRAAGADPRSCGTTPGMRLHLTRDRTRHWQRLEKLLEDALCQADVGGGQLAGHRLGPGHDRGA